MSEPSHRIRRTLLVGANPFVTLYADDRPTAYASLWRVDWSRWGSGSAVVLWVAGEVRVIGDDVEVAGAVERNLVRHFDEAKELPGWGRPAVEEAPTRVEVDPEAGATAVAGDVEIRIHKPLDARPFADPDFTIRGTSHGLAMQVAPCERARIRVAGKLLSGQPRVVWKDARPTSSAVVTFAESWSA